MTITRRIFVSSPRIRYLDNRRKELKRAIVKEIEALGYKAQMFGSAEESRGLASDKTWSPKDADDVMKRCVGAAILGFPIWQCRGATADKTVSLVSEYCHYEGAIARTLGPPILPVLDDGVKERVFFNPYGGDPFLTIPAEADHTWVKENDFQAFLEKWHKRLKDRKDIFLGYSSEAEGTAKNIARLLSSYEATVLDWRDFKPGTILEQIEAAASRCSAGIFLFTNSDKLEGQEEKAAPRDNVVFEAGYFAHAKGHQRVLIVREAGSKMPADLGGEIFAPLADRANIDPIARQLESFVKSLYSDNSSA
jgi:hypothetical protein